MLTDAQSRLLGFCARNPVWLTLTELEQFRMLESGDVNQVDLLVDAGFLVRAHHISAVRITPVGMERAAMELRSLNEDIGLDVTADIDKVRVDLKEKGYPV